MKYLTEKIPKDASSKVRVNRDLYTQERYNLGLAATILIIPQELYLIKANLYNQLIVSPLNTIHQLRWKVFSNRMCPLTFNFFSFPFFSLFRKSLYWGDKTKIYGTFRHKTMQIMMTCY